MSTDRFACQDEIVRLRRQLHACPELAFHEFETSKLVKDYLDAHGIAWQPIGETGVRADILSPAANAHTVAVRAEMDAVPVREETGLPFQSKNEGVMHACGHDATVACALVLCRLMHEKRSTLTNNARFLFQPAEENGEGTDVVLKSGALEGVDAILLYHFAADLPAGMEVQYGPCSATLGNIDVAIHGRSAHWSRKELGIDAMRTAHRIMNIIYDIADSFQSDRKFVVGLGSVHGGNNRNIVCREAKLEGTLRAAKIEDYFELKRRIEEGIAALDTEAKIDLRVSGTPILSMVNHDSLVDLARKVGPTVWQDDFRLVSDDHLSGDAAYAYFLKTRGMFMVFTAKKAGCPEYPLHNGHFDIDEGSFHKTVETLYDLIEAVR